MIRVGKSQKKQQARKRKEQITIDDINFSRPVWCYQSTDGKYVVYRGNKKTQRVFVNITQKNGYITNQSGLGHTVYTLHPKLLEIACGNYTNVQGGAKR